MLRAFFSVVVLLGVLCGLRSAEENPYQDKESGVELKRLEDEKAESYSLRVKLSGKEREEFEKDHAGFMKKYLEARGHKVDEYVVTPKSAKAIQKIIASSRNNDVLEFTGGVKHVPKCTYI